MSDPSERSITAAREPAATAAGRCLMYAVLSDVIASPFDTEPAVAGQEIVTDELGLPYAVGDLQPLLDEWRAADRDALRREYSGLFEVGSDGPPVPIREDLHRNQPAGVREDIVRFYDFFGYGLSEKFAWAPDHLSVELEFMHYLTYQESRVADPDAAESVDSDVLSFQLAQLDFSERHLANWVPELATRAGERQPGALYARILAATGEFLLSDYAWQQSTVAVAAHN